MMNHLKMSPLNNNVKVANPYENCFKSGQMHYFFIEINQLLIDNTVLVIQLCSDDVLIRNCYPKLGQVFYITSLLNWGPIKSLKAKRIRVFGRYIISNVLLINDS